MYTEEELLEAVDILVEEYGYDEDEAINMIAESYENIDSLSEENAFKKEMRDDFNSRYNDEEKAILRNAGRGAAVGSLAIGGAYALKRAKDKHVRKKERKALKANHRRELEHIRRTGRRTTEMNEAGPLDGYKPYDSEHIDKRTRNVAYGTGIAMGALAAGGYAAYSNHRDKKRHSRRMDRLRRKYTRKEDKEKAIYRAKNTQQGGEQ